MSLSGTILRLMGWSVDITVPDYPKCIICVAPHTSNLDFIMGKLAYASVHRKAGFLMKKSWFFFPLGIFFRAIGGVPVDRSGRSGSLVTELVDRFRTSDRLALAITPEGTRKRTTRWHTGFLRIALEADIPVVLGAIDFATKRIIIKRTFAPTGDIEADISAVKDYYKPFVGRHPHQFTSD